MNTENKERKHSELGIASFIITIVVIILIILAFVFNQAVGVEILMSLVALGLGIGGLMQKDRKKIFAILGIILSVIIIACFCVFALWAIASI